MQATTKFHGGEEVDYQGRSWMHPPSGVRPGDGDHECFIPKKCVKKYAGHTKGVHAIEFMPKTGKWWRGGGDGRLVCDCVCGAGHLILSASIDGKCKIWDVYGDRSLKRTYAGHNEAIR